MITIELNENYSEEFLKYALEFEKDLQIELKQLEYAHLEKIHQMTCEVELQKISSAPIAEAKASTTKTTKSTKAASTQNVVEYSEEDLEFNETSAFTLSAPTDVGKISRQSIYNGSGFITGELISKLSSDTVNKEYKKLAEMAPKKLTTLLRFILFASGASQRALRWPDAPDIEALHKIKSECVTKVGVYTEKERILAVNYIKTEWDSFSPTVPFDTTLLAKVIDEAFEKQAKENCMKKAIDEELSVENLTWFKLVLKTLKDMDENFPEQAYMSVYYALEKTRHANPKMATQAVASIVANHLCKNRGYVPPYDVPEGMTNRKGQVYTQNIVNPSLHRSIPNPPHGDYVYSLERYMDSIFIPLYTAEMEAEYRIVFDKRMAAGIINTPAHMLKRK